MLRRLPLPRRSRASSVTEIADLGDELDARRKEAIARDDRITLSSMYRAMAKLRGGEGLTPVELECCRLGDYHGLIDLHDRLDRSVVAAYGWPWPMEPDAILTKLIRLHTRRGQGGG
jgi:hypothetical protein